MNAIGDADLCGLALERAEALARATAAPVINRPARVKVTGRAENARRLGCDTRCDRSAHRERTRASLESGQDLESGPGLRSTGISSFRCSSEVPAFTPAGTSSTSRTGRPSRGAAARSRARSSSRSSISMRGARTARRANTASCSSMVCSIRCTLQSPPIGRFTTSAPTWRARPRFREEERRFLNDMPAVLGARAMRALEGVRGLGARIRGRRFRAGARRRGTRVRGERHDGGLPARCPTRCGITGALRSKAVLGAARRMLDKYAGRVTVHGTSGGLELTCLHVLVAFLVYETVRREAPLPTGENHVTLLGDRNLGAARREAGILAFSIGQCTLQATPLPGPQHGYTRSAPAAPRSGGARSSSTVGTRGSVAPRALVRARASDRGPARAEPGCAIRDAKRHGIAMVAIDAVTRGDPQALKAAL